MGRRFEKKLYDGETLTVHRKFVYDGYKLIGVYDALNNDAEELSFVWQPETAGLDVPLSMKHDNAAYYYVTDGNKNVTALYDATGAEAANYVYGPFGQTLAANGRGGESPAAVDYEGGKVAAICNLLSCTGDEMHRPEDLDLDMLFCMELGGDSGIGGDGNASALRTVFGMEAMDRQYGASASSPLPPGGLALVNPFRFSSEFHDDELGLVYYNYRYYNPQLGRWTKRDPIGEDGGINLYSSLSNNTIYTWDNLGNIDPSQITFRELTRKLAYAKLKKWEQKHLKELEERFKNLCPQTCCTTIANEIIYHDECEVVAQKVAAGIISNVKALISNFIATFDDWPPAGNLGNIKDKIGLGGIICDEWCTAVEKSFATDRLTLDGRKVFFYRSIINTKDKLIATTSHTWTEIFGPCNRSTTTFIGDFSIDFWPSGGREIEYRVLGHDMKYITGDYVDTLVLNK